jgi:hypothetical protein
LKSRRRVTLELPASGNNYDYARAITLAIANASRCGNPGGAAALAGLLSAVTSLPDHNPETELGPCYADIDQALRQTTRRLA